MLVTGRCAARVSREVLPSDEQARLLLRTAIGGPGVQTSAGLLFDETRVQEQPWSVALMSVRIRAWGSFPLVPTFLGYVVLAADLTGMGERSPALDPPGGWARAVEARRWRTPPGGRPWYLWTPDTDRSPGADRRRA